MSLLVNWHVYTLTEILVADSAVPRGRNRERCGYVYNIASAAAALEQGLCRTIRSKGCREP